MSLEDNYLEDLDKTITVFRRLKSKGDEVYRVELQKKKEEIVSRIKDSSSDLERSRQIHALKLLCGAESYLQREFDTLKAENSYEKLTIGSAEEINEGPSKKESPQCTPKRIAYAALISGVAVGATYLMAKHSGELEQIIKKLTH